MQGTVSRSEAPPACRLDLLVPEEDPTRPVDFVDSDPHDEYASLVEDGIGEEDEIEQDDDDGDRAVADAGAQSLANEQRRQSRTRPLPPWLMDAFRAHLEESRERGPDKLPALYRTGTFWFPQRSSYFLLRSRLPTPQLQYNPRFFLWDPLSLYNIPCPSCKTCLSRNGPISYPRRVVDLDSAFWIIGYRYRCSVCRNPRTNKVGTVTFRSWDSRILSALPPDLRAEFPARLSRRSGISNQIFHLMRSCFQNGMGAKQFSDALRVQHLRHYDHIHLQYLQHLYGRRSISGSLTGPQTFPAFLPFDDISPDGYRGFVPGALWLRDMYDNFMEEHTADIDQHTAMLSAEVCAIDHSHKVRQVMPIRVGCTY